jgi:hypothetical protein
VQARNKEQPARPAVPAQATRLPQDINPSECGSLWKSLDASIPAEPPPPAPPQPRTPKPKTSPMPAAAPPPESKDASLWPFLDLLEPDKPDQ